MLRPPSLLVALNTSLRFNPFLARSARRFMSTSNYEYIIVAQPEPRVALITLNRPKALNALCTPLFNELNKALADLDGDDGVGAVVLTGSEKAFAGELQTRRKTWLLTDFRSGGGYQGDEG